jgi:hypothetical protein
MSETDGLYNIVRSIENEPDEVSSERLREVRRRTKEETAKIMGSVRQGPTAIALTLSRMNRDNKGRGVIGTSFVPNEMWMQIFGYLNHRDLVAVGETCIHWATLVSEGISIWKLWDEATERSVRECRSILKNATEMYMESGSGSRRKKRRVRWAKIERYFERECP